MGLLEVFKRSAVKYVATKLSIQHVGAVIANEIGFDVCQLAGEVANRFADQAMVRMQKQSLDRREGDLTGYECAVIKLSYLYRHASVSQEIREEIYEALVYVHKQGLPFIRYGVAVYASEKAAPRRLLADCGR